MSELSNLIGVIVQNHKAFECPWSAFSIVIGFDDDGDPDSSYGYLYKSDGDFEAISAGIRAIRPFMSAYLSTAYENESFPLKLLLQFDRTSGRFNIEFEDNNPNRWAVTPANIHGFIESLRPKFDQ